jgi:hypothetical protein
MRWLLEPHGDRQTLLILVYLLFSLPLAIVGFVVVLVFVAVGLGLLITLAGLPLLAVGMRFAHALASIERSLVASMLDAPMPRATQLSRQGATGGFFWRELSTRIRSGQTWGELGFAMLQLPLAVLNFVVGVGLIGLMFGGFAFPVLQLAGVDSEFGTWEIDSFGESLIFIPASLLFLAVAPRLLIAWRPIPVGVSTLLLGRLGWGELRQAVGEAIAGRGHGDAFEILDDLQRRYGPGPWVSPVRVEGALLAMTEAGVIGSEPSPEGTRYLPMQASPLAEHDH